ncbi:Hypothetical protein D9617_16g013650 [Elsinoe fawcettii]|nr:Hypothetical protein D9617_16g013650 [Elsinoe fawcettii]
MHTIIYYISLLVAVLPSQSQPLPGLVEIFRAGPGTEFENIAIRRNGDLLVTAVGSNALFEVKPFAAEKAAPVASIPGATSLTGITEISRDLFAVVAGNYTRQASAQRGSFSLWAVDVSGRPVVSKIADLPAGGFLNGATTIPPTAGSCRNGTALVSDTITGSIFHVDPNTSKVTLPFSVLANSTAPPAFVQSGVNGLRYLQSTKTLYFTNTIRAIFGSVKLQITSQGQGSPSIIASNITTIASQLPGDDFLVQPDGSGFLSANPINTFFRFTAGGRVKPLIGGINSTDLIGPTGVAFGRTREDRDALYITSTGLTASITNQTSPGGIIYKLRLD